MFVYEMMSVLSSTVSLTWPVLGGLTLTPTCRYATTVSSAIHTDVALRIQPHTKQHTQHAAYTRIETCLYRSHT